MLDAQQIPHQVLNARHIAREAEIVADAGQPSRVTVATNMAVAVPTSNWAAVSMHSADCTSSSRKSTNRESIVSLPVAADVKAIQVRCSDSCRRTTIS